ncbi:hypothetical protein J6590_072499 [Homalodisca vitripennis]|nr:hypothetical protein J6590_072499 [Homalodisca vitripennis]
MVYRKNKVMDDGIKHFVFIISSNTSIARYEKRCCVAMKQSLGTSRQKPLGGLPDTWDSLQVRSVRAGSPRGARSIDLK